MRFFLWSAVVLLAAAGPAFAQSAGGDATQTATVSQFLGMVLSEDAAKRVVVGQVAPGSPAARSGLQPGDMLVRVDEHRVGLLTDLSLYIERVIAGKQPGTGVEIQAFRGDKRMMFEVPLSIAESEPRSNRIARGGFHGVETLADDFGNQLFGMTLTDNPGGNLRVLKVERNTPAERAGIQPGDAITAVGETAVTSSVELADVLQGNQAGEPLVLQVIRDGRPLRIEAALHPSVDNASRSEETWTHVSRLAGQLAALRQGGQALAGTPEGERLLAQVNEMERTVQDLARSMQGSSSGGVARSTGNASPRATASGQSSSDNALPQANRMLQDLTTGSSRPAGSSGSGGGDYIAPLPGTGDDTTEDDQSTDDDSTSGSDVTDGLDVPSSDLPDVGLPEGIPDDPLSGDEMGGSATVEGSGAASGQGSIVPPTNGSSVESTQSGATATGGQAEGAGVELRGSSQQGRSSSSPAGGAASGEASGGATR